MKAGSSENQANNLHEITYLLIRPKASRSKHSR